MADNDVFASGDRVEAMNAQGQWLQARARSNVYRGKDMPLVDVEFPLMRAIWPWPASAVRHAPQGTMVGGLITPADQRGNRYVADEPASGKGSA